METQLRQQIDQRHRAEADLLAVRDLCMKLDQQKDALVEQLGDKDTVKAHVNPRFYIIFCTRQLDLSTFFFIPLIVRGAIVETED